LQLEREKEATVVVAGRQGVAGIFLASPAIVNKGKEKEIKQNNKIK
jgi:hypothetical protein